MKKIFYNIISKRLLKDLFDINNADKDSPIFKLDIGSFTTGYSNGFAKGCWFSYGFIKALLIINIFLLIILIFNITFFN